jgi:hypothetical protein
VRAAFRDRERADRERQLEVAVRLKRPERTHRRAAADGLQPRNVIECRDLRRAGDRPAGKRRPQDVGQRRVGAHAAFDGRHEMRDARELVLRHQLRPANRADLGDARQIVALEIDDHHVLRCVLRVVHVLADRSRSLDRHRHEPVPTTREEELRRG